MCVFCREAKTHVVRVLSCVERADGGEAEPVARAKTEQCESYTRHTRHDRDTDTDTDTDADTHCAPLSSRER